MKKPKYGEKIRDYFVIKYFKQDDDWCISVFHHKTGKQCMYGSTIVPESCSKEILRLYQFLSHFMQSQDYPFCNIHASHIDERIDNDTGLPILHMQLIFKCEGDTNNDFPYFNKFDGIAI
jgi:hypothetical protein